MHIIYIKLFFDEQTALRAVHNVLEGKGRDTETQHFIKYVYFTKKS